MSYAAPTVPRFEDSSQILNQAFFPDKRLIPFLNVGNSIVHEKCRMQLKQKCLIFVSGTNHYETFSVISSRYEIQQVTEN